MTGPRPRHLASLLVVLAVLAACPLSGKGRGKYEPVELGEKDQEILEVVDDMDLLFERRGNVLRNPDAEALVTRVCSSVLPDEIEEEYMDFTFRILRDPTPNAFAMPNGSIYLTTGLLLRLEDEAQLAGICAHEAVHVLGHHTFISAKSLRKKTAGAVAGSMVLGVAAIGVGGTAGSLLRQASGIGVQVLYQASVKGYSRDLEEEADRRAIEMMVDAGYDPRALVETFAILAIDYEGLHVERSTFWLDHPSLAHRIDYTQMLIATEYPDLGKATELQRGRETYIASMEHAARHDIRLQIRAGNYRTAVAVAELLVDRYGEDPENLVLMGDAWRALGPREEVPEAEELSVKSRKRRRKAKVQQTREERERAAFARAEGREEWEEHFDEAEWAYRRALRKDPETAEAWRGLGYLYEKDGQPAEAARAYRTYLEARPDAMDRYVIRRHLALMEELAPALGGGKVGPAAEEAAAEGSP